MKNSAIINQQLRVLATPKTRRELYMWNKKPHIYRGHWFFPYGWEGQAWNCAGQDKVGSGPTPQAAYEAWVRAHDGKRLRNLYA
jgi:hypothetical protein